MKCSKCLFENRDGVKFCEECGASFEIECPVCKTKIPPQRKFCGECGHNLSLSIAPPKEFSFDEKIARIQKYLPKGITEKILSQRDKIEGEHKQVTVMFCDMKGFTLLSEKADAETLYTIMDQVYEILIHKIHDYEGTVNEMTGDGIVALFGAPITLEDAPQRAIRSAMAIHREMVRLNEKVKNEKRNLPPLKMRVGVHTGAVVVGTLGNDLRVEFKAVGDTVNLASRMESLAEPGTTYVSEETFKLTEGFFRFEALGEKEIKGKIKPLRVYRVIAPSTRRTRFDVNTEMGLTPLVGRERELELLLDGFERSKAGRGQAFSIISEAGLGKSRLLYELRKAVVNEDATFLEGKCLSYSKGVAYHPIIDILKANFDILEGDEAATIREKLKSGLKMLGLDRALIEPYFLELLSVKDSGIDDMSMSPGSKKDRIMEALKQFILKVSEIRPLIIAYEDLHWVDKSSEDVFKNVLESIPGASVLMLFTYRPEFVHTWGSKSFHSQITLNRLSNRESLIMASYLLGMQELERSLEEFILEKTEGVPFFIEELIKSLKDLNIIERKNNRYRLTKDIREAIIPSTIHDVIMARVDSLPDEAKGLLQTISVVGRESSYDLLRQATGFAEQELLGHLSILKDSELLYERGIYPRSTFIFKHALTQEVTYNSLLLKKRKKIHEKLGEAIEILYPNRLEENYELLAYHYASSANMQKAVQYLDLANQEAIRINAAELAKAYFDRAMKLLDNLPETEENRQRRISLLVKQGEVILLLLKFEEYYTLLTRYESMASKLGAPDLLGVFYARLGQCEWALGRFEQSIQKLTKAGELCEASGSFENAGLAYAWLGWDYCMMGRYEQVFALKEKLLHMMAQRFNPRWYVRGICVVSRAYVCLGRWDEAVAEAKQALKAAEASSDNSLVLYAIFTLSIAYTWKGDLDRGIEYGQLALQKAGTPGDKAWAQRSLGWALCRAGQAKKAIKLLAAALSIVRASRHMPTEIISICILGAGYWLAGEIDNAKQTLEEGVEIATRCGAIYYVGFAQRILGEIALKTNLPQAEAYFQKSIAVLQKIKAENELALAYVGYGRFYKQKGQITRAREYLTKALKIFERLGTLIEPEKVRKMITGLPE